MSLLGLAPSLALSLALASPSSFVVEGDARDALFLPSSAGADEAGVWVSRTSRRGQRELVLVDEQGKVRRTVRVPRGAVSVAACARRGLVFSDARGIVDDEGERLLEGPALLGVPDPSSLYTAPLCADAAPGELRLAVRDGLRVLSADGSVVTLPFVHRARAYSGQVHRGLRGTRPYALALSLYAPHLLDADMNGDGRVDLVAVHEARVGVFLRGADGKLTPDGAVVRDLEGVLGGGDDVDLRVHVSDLDADGRADVVLSLTRGAVPDRSTVIVLSADALANPRAAEKARWQRDGLLAPLGVVRRGAGRDLVLAEVDTSLTALGSALLTGYVSLEVRLYSLASRRGPSSVTRPLALSAQLDVRAGRMAGAMPVVSVDFDGDGREDLLDLGRPGRAALYPGGDSGFRAQPVAEHTVGPFAHVVPMPALPGVVLIGEPENGKTRVTLLKGERPRASRR